MATPYAVASVVADSHAVNAGAADCGSSRRVLWGILLLALLVRLPGIERPLLGNFATRNVVQAMAARNWARGEAPWWRPTLDVLADGEPAWHLVEVPCSAYLSAALWKAFGGSLDTWGRLTAIGWSLLSVALVYNIVRRRAGDVAAGAAAFAIAISPISVIYGQSFLLEPSVVALALVAWWGTERLLQSENASPTRQRGGEDVFGGGSLCPSTTSSPPRWRYGLVWACLIGTVLAALWLSKVYMLAIALPLVMRVWSASPRSRDLLLYLTLLGVAALPTLWWCVEVWRLAQPEAPTAGRVYYSLIGTAGDHGFPHALLFDPQFYSQFARDLGTVVLTPVGAIVLVFGATRVAWRAWWPLGVVMVLLVVAMPRKFHEMNYYHLLFLPAWAGIIGLGWQAIVERYTPSRWLTGAVIGFVLVLAARYSVRPAFLTPEEDRSVIQAAQALRTLAAPDDKVIASHGSTFDLLYYCDRRGWALPMSDVDVAERIEQHRRAGAKWLVIAGERRLVVPAAAEESVRRFSVAALGVGFRIYRLEAAGTAETREESAANTAMPTAPGAK